MTAIVNAAGQKPQFFISRAGADNAIALAVEKVLATAGHITIIQDLDFKNHSFMERMDAGLKSGAKLIALLSPDYMASEHCQAEWMNPLADDPLNRNGRLVILRVKHCAPEGLLRSIAYCNLVPLLADPAGNAERLAAAVLGSIEAGRRSAYPELSELYYAPQAILHPDIKPRPGFTGRGALMDRIDNALWPGDGGPPARPFVLTGLPGVGKSTLAREFASEVSDANGYTGIWWMNAQKAKDAEAWPGIEQGLNSLWDALYPRDKDRKPANPTEAAQGTLRFLQQHGSDKPWLLIWDNFDNVKALTTWQPPANVRLLITSRLGNWSKAVEHEEVTIWTPAEAIDYLRHESGRDFTDEDAGSIVEALGRLPLALSHAAAVLRVRPGLTAVQYLKRLETHMNADAPDAEYTRATFATFREALEVAEQTAPGAAAVVSLAAFVAPDDIPDLLFQQDAAHYPEALRAFIADAERLGSAIDALDHLSLIDYAPGPRTFSMHRLVQAAARDALGAEAAVWSAAAVDVINSAWPGGEFQHWPQVGRIIAHARAAADRAGDAVGVPLALLLNRAGYFLNARAAYELAEPLYKRDLKISETALGPDHPDVGTSLNNLAGLYRAQGKYELAEPLYKRTISIFETALGPDHPSVGTSLNNLAGLYEAQGKYELAEPLYKRTISIFETALGPDHPDVGTSLNNLAALYEAQGKYELAEPLYKRSLAIRETALGPDHPSVGTSLNNLAALYEAQGKYELAEPLYKRSLAIRETALGPDHPSVGASLNNLAALYEAQGKYELAEPLYKRSLAISETALGPDHPSVGASLNNLAGLYEAQGKYELAEPLYKRSLAISETALGPDHPSVGTFLNNIAGLYRAQGKYDLAEPLYKRTISIFETALGPDHPSVGTSLNNLAGLYEAQGKYELAEPLYKRTISIFETALGPDHPDVGTSLNNLAALYEAQGKYELAEPLYKRSLAIRETALGPDHPSVGTSLNNLAALYEAQGKYELAEPLYKRSLAIRETALGPDHPSVGASLNNLAGLYEAQGKYELAEPLYKRTISIFETALGPDHPSVGTSLNNLAGLYEAQGKYELAEPLYKRTISIFETALGPDHTDVGTSLNNLAALYEAQGKYELAEPLYKRSLAIRETALGPDHPSVGTSLVNMAELVMRAGKPAEAVAMAQRGHTIFLRALGADHPNTKTAAGWVGRLSKA